MEDNLNSNIRKNALITGLALGGILLILSIITFYFITGMNRSMLLIVAVPFVLSIILPLAITIFFTSALRKKIGGYWIFKQAVTGMFIMFLAAYVVQTVGRDLVFAKLIEPNMVKKTGDAMIVATTTMLEKSGASQNKIDEKVAELHNQFNAQNNLTISAYIGSLAITIIFLFILSLIFAAMFKRDPPLYATTINDNV